MRYARINAKDKFLQTFDADSFEAALDAAGLADVGRDHGAVDRSTAIVVYEYGLFEPTDQQYYFSLGRMLYGGNALLYAVDEAGETIDLKRCPEPTFYTSAADVEAAIAAGKIDRPIRAFNGAIQWEWPSP